MRFSVVSGSCSEAGASATTRGPHTQGSRSDTQTFHIQHGPATDGQRRTGHEPLPCPSPVSSLLRQLSGMAAQEGRVQQEIDDVKAKIAWILALDRADPERPVQLQRLAGLEQQLAELYKERNRLPEGGSQVTLPDVAVRCVLRFHRPLGAEPSILASDEVEHLIRAGESSVVDFKEVRVDVDPSSSRPRVQWSNKDIAVAACGFANTAMGGVLVCGINDKSREVTGIDPTSMEALKSHISQALLSCASPCIKHALSSVQVHDSKGELKWVVAVDIPPGHELTEAGDPRAVYQRHGDQNVKKQGVALEDLKQGWNAVRGRLDAGDIAPVPGALLEQYLDKTKLETLDLGALAGTGNASIIAHQLRAMHLAAGHSGDTVLTVAGLLLLSKVDNWQYMLSRRSFGIQIQVFNNDDPPGTYPRQYSTDIFHSEEVYGDALRQIDLTMTIIMATTVEQYKKRVIKDAQGNLIVRGFQHELYPRKALQELLVNAIVHRTYRETTGKIIIKIRHRSLEFVVPGDFLPGISASNIGSDTTCSFPRNPTLANFMHDIHKVGERSRIFEGHGLGVARARKEIEQAGGKLQYRSESTGAITVMVTAAPTPPDTPSSSPRSANALPNRDTVCQP